jgi:hypothetical protein
VAWQDDTVTILRVLLNDPDAATYSDDSLTKTVLVAAMQVKNELLFAQTYTINLSRDTLSPDPTLDATKDEAFLNLITLKAACIADKGAAALAAVQAIYVKDGASAIDLRERFKAKLALILKGGWCAAYADAKLEHQMGYGGVVAGQAVLTPFRLCVNGDYLRGDHGCF